jgi:nucleoid-associated protein YgaU
VAFLLLWGYFRHIFKIQKASIQEKNEAVSFLHQQLVNSSNQNEIFRVELEKWRNRPVSKFYYGRTVAFTPPLLDTVYYIVQPRDYMEAVALYFYNDKTRYQSLCELNNINDPNVLPQNDTLTIPPQ